MPLSVVRAQIQSTIVPVVIQFRLEDLTNITSERRGELIDYFDKAGLPHVVTETHYIISADMQHDNAFVQKIFDDFIMPYMKENALSVTHLHVRSDGCKVLGRSRLQCALPSACTHQSPVPGPHRLHPTQRAGTVQVRGQLPMGLGPVH